ncbi:MAG: aldo/keto reductase [Bacteroidia bacterium]|nr:aldo/keto reductase [Bacteroidia bacterium]
MDNKNKIMATGRREFLQKGTLAALSVPFLNFYKPEDIKIGPTKNKDKAKPEWRNKQEGMVYRQLGRTGLMVSELVYGTERNSPDNTRPVELAFERGINYFDTAPSYNKGLAEETLAKVFNTPSKRDKVFFATKVTAFFVTRNRLYREIFDKLPASDQEEIMTKAKKLRLDSGIEKPEYFMVYWPGQQKQMDGAFISDAMKEKYGDKVERSPDLKNAIVKSVEESLKRAGTDYFDVLHCPHAAATSEEIRNPLIIETFNELKKQGKVRFLGFSSHHGMGELIKTAMELDYFDVIMLAYNVINHAFLDHLLTAAREKGIGLIAMKAAMAVATPYDPAQVPVPEWRVSKLNRIIPEEMKLQVKAFLWALQNQDISAVNAGMYTEEMILENLTAVGRKVDLNLA